MNSEDPRRELIRRCLDGESTAAEFEALEKHLRNDPPFRDVYVRYMNMDLALEDAAHGISGLKENLRDANAKVVPFKEPTPSNSVFNRWRPISAAAGFVLGLLSATVTWAISSTRPVVSVQQLSSLVDGNFEGSAGRLPAGLPDRTGIWSGDSSEMVASNAGDGKDRIHGLRFLRAEGEPSLGGGTPNSCDVYQIVDLRPLRAAIGSNVEAELELSMSVVDTRPSSAIPVRFGAFLFLLAGEPESLRSVWPKAKQDAVSMGIRGWDSYGGDGSGSWKTLKARCHFPEQADFALVQVSAGRSVKSNSPAPELGAQYVRDVHLSLRRYPSIPERVIP